jgi:hypothetical protein
MDENERLNDEWLTFDRQRELDQMCDEGVHDFDRRFGVCRHCGLEDETFDPDRLREERRERMEEVE